MGIGKVWDGLLGVVEDIRAGTQSRLRLWVLWVVVLAEEITARVSRLPPAAIVEVSGGKVVEHWSRSNFVLLMPFHDIFI